MGCNFFFNSANKVLRHLNQSVKLQNVITFEMLHHVVTFEMLQHLKCYNIHCIVAYIYNIITLLHTYHYVTFW